MQSDCDDSIAQGAEHFVYIYRDERGRPRYVGYGRFTTRATSHLTGSHNPELNTFLADQRFRVEIAGPYESEQAGRAVEIALISILQPDLNVDLGPSAWRFRPLGVPAAYVDRWTQRELLLQDFIDAQGARPVPVLFVIVTDEDFADGRIGYNAATPPTDSQIRERVEKWWQLRKYLGKWMAAPDDSPGLLVGVHGRPGAQFVIASMLIDRDKWAAAEGKRQGKIRIPLSDPSNLDAHRLRGRRIARAARLAFGNWPSQFYVVLGRDAVTHGGRRQTPELTQGAQRPTGRLGVKLR
ncbi:MAG: hypothetical protein ACREJ6_11720 [Candidatus Methylomirabilis sp.]